MTTPTPRDPGAPDDPATAEAPPPQLPADPAAYDSPRATQARARGLSAPYIAGGLDPDPERGRAQERRDLRRLIVLVLVVVFAGFVLGIIANALGLTFLLGNP